MPSDPLPILIIGAGISGLTLAQYLRKVNVPFRIFERDASMTSRTGGWGLTVHWALSALEEQLLPADIASRLRETSVNKEAARRGDPGRYRFFNLQTGDPKYESPPSTEGRIRVLRTKLRALLATNINIEWSKKLVNIEDNEDSVTAFFEDGSSCQGRLLMACDGANSRVRKHLYPTTYQNQPIPVRFLGATVRYSEEQVTAVKALDPYFFQGTHAESNVYLYFSFLDTPFNFDDSSDDYVVQIVVSWPESKGIDIPDGNEERVALMKQLTQDWAEPFRGLVHNISDNAEVTAITMQDWFPTARREQGHGRVVLMGDAAHTMTMFRGEGANNAVADVQDFVKRVGHLIQQPSEKEDWPAMEKALEAYDQDVFARGRPCVLSARQACLDAHDFPRITEESPLISKRVRQQS